MNIIFLPVKVWAVFCYWQSLSSLRILVLWEIFLWSRDGLLFVCLCVTDLICSQIKLLSLVSGLNTFWLDERKCFTKQDTECLVTTKCFTRRKNKCLWLELAFPYLVCCATDITKSRMVGVENRYGWTVLYLGLFFPSEANLIKGVNLPFLILITCH